jgi:NADH:ubiquinone oxidoreductase subunit E
MSRQALEELLDDAVQTQRGLIPTLQAVQKLEGFLSDSVIGLVAKALGRPIGEISEVVDFYAFLQREPRGKHHIIVCMATSCNAQGSATVLESLRNELGVNAGEVTADGRFSLEMKFCLGACGRGPNLQINDEVFNFVVPEDVPQILRDHSA